MEKRVRINISLDITTEAGALHLYRLLQAVEGAAQTVAESTGFVTGSVELFNSEMECNDCGGLMREDDERRTIVCDDCNVGGDLS